MEWFADLALLPASRAALAALHPDALPAGAVLFRPGDRARGFAVILSGRIEVRLTAASGREVLLYAIEPGESCVQTTLGLLGDESYSGEAVTVTPARLAMIPRPLFLRLMDEDRAFRDWVLRALGRRMADVTRVLEQVAFGRVEVRLAQALLSLASGDLAEATQAELAARIGTAREVVTRRLDQFARHGWTRSERGHVRLLDRPALERLAAEA